MPAAAAAAAAAAAPASSTAAAAPVEPAAKRLKATPPDPMAVRKQIEYYLSDDNLKHDKFFHEKISSNSEGWLEMSLVLTCNKMLALRATKEDVIAALQASKVEVHPDSTSIRRPGNAPLPTLVARQLHGKKNSPHVHDGGVIAVFRNIPEEQSWMQIKEKLNSMLPPKVNLLFVSTVSEKNECVIVAAPFEGDIAFFEGLTLDLEGAKLKCEVAFGEPFQKAVKLLPKIIRDRRDKESRRRQKERNRPVVIGTQRFTGVQAVRGRVKEIVNAKKDGEQLKVEGGDFKLIKALLAYHPGGPKKSEGMVGIKVDKSLQADNRCFFMIKESGEMEDVSLKKCIDELEKAPPYADPAAPAAKPAAPAAGAAAAPARIGTDAKDAAADAAKVVAAAVAPAPAPAEGEKPLPAAAVEASPAVPAASTEAPPAVPAAAAAPAKAETDAKDAAAAEEAAKPTPAA
eukprot:NODE_5893_length_1724_cov_8.797746.p1 GENE.NODE_5893_length_1724_cov_8.797746~~NODE_5893_length_1724_cov_8.797746.p1  ORF type:complete len:466 (+),score=160.23 NODE_5893_length_1724_cov_8.797746:26-1399(+)